jgi:hypothetical protein
MGTHACYHHVVVVWRGMVIDYESEHTFSLTNYSLRQICGVNTSYAGISCRYGIFPPKYIKNSMENESIEDWGIKEYKTTGSLYYKRLKCRRRRCCRRCVCTVNSTYVAISV